MHGLSEMGGEQSKLTFQKWIKEAVKTGREKRATKWQDADAHRTGWQRQQYMGGQLKSRLTTQVKESPVDSVPE